MTKTILVTEKEYAKGQDIFGAAEDFDIQPVPLEEDVFAARVRETGARGVIVGVDNFVGPLYEALGETGGDRGAIIARFGVGHDGVDKDKARAHNIAVTNTPGVLDESVAELAFWMMGALSRRLTTLHDAMREGDFMEKGPGPEGPGFELKGKTLGIIGFGAIGRRVAAMAHFGAGMKILAGDVMPQDQLERVTGKSFAEIQAETGVEEYTNDLDSVFERADVVSSHIPGIPATDKFFNAERLGHMRSKALFVNTSRGSVVDEEALYDALKTRRIAAAALDVYQVEPYVPVAPDKDLRTLPNVLLTPHVGSNTIESNQRMAGDSLENVRQFLAGNLEALSRVDQ